MVAISPEQSVPQESRKKKTPDTVKIEKYSEVWEHAKNLEGKIKKLKEHAIDADEIGEIEGILKDAKGYFSRFGEKKDKGRSVAQLEERRKAAVEKLTDLNRRMVSMLEKLGQPIPNTLLSYKDSGFVDIVKESNKEGLSEEKKEEVSEVVGAHIIQPPENYSKESLGDSEIGGVNSIEAPEKKEEVLVSAEESPVNVREESSSPETPIEDVIKISSGGKTYEFGWHEQVVYTTAKGKQLECIVLGKSNDENKPGLILKDLEKGKVFALGADAVAKRVHVSDGEIVSPRVENNKADSGQSAEGEDIDREEKAALEKMKKDQREVEEKKAQELSELLAQAGKSAEDDTSFVHTSTDERGSFDQKMVDKLVADGSIEKINTLLKNKSEVWVQEDGKWYQGVVQDITGAQVGVTVGEEGREKKYFYVDAEEFLGMQDRAKKLLKYKKELELPSVVVDTEFLARPDTITKGEIFTPPTERKTVPDVPLVSIDTPLPVRERKTYPEVSEKKAIQMIQSVAEEFEKTWKGMRMMTTEKQKTGWLQSKEVEREMTVTEKKEQLEAWLDMVEQAFDSLDKQKDGTHMEKPVLMWHQAQALIRALENELRYTEETNKSEEWDHALEAFSSIINERSTRLKEKKKGSLIAPWAMKTTLAALGAFAIGNATNNRIEDVAAVSERYMEAGEKKYELPREEHTGDAQRNMLDFVINMNRMINEPTLSITPVAIDARLTPQIKDKISGKVPGLAGAEIASDGKSVTLTFDNNQTVESRPEKIQKSGRDSWKLKTAEKKGPEYGEQMLRELRKVLGEVKQEFPDMFRGPESSSKQKRVVRTVVQAEKKLREAEVVIPRSGEARRQLEQVKQVLEQVKPGLESISKEIVDEIKAEDLELPQDVFVRFSREVTFDPKADALFEEWGNARNSLKAAQEAGDQEGVKKSNEELRKVIEKITKEYSK